VARRTQWSTLSNREVPNDDLHGGWRRGLPGATRRCACYASRTST
jgi:hypothetical protein